MSVVVRMPNGHIKLMIKGADTVIYERLSPGNMNKEVTIQHLEDFPLTSLNVLIGGNGAGKSNFIDSFRMLRAMMELPLPGLASASLKSYIATNGGSDDFLFN